MENLTEKWGKNEKTRDKSQRRPGRGGKEKGTALERRADKRVPPPPPFSIPRFANPGWMEGLWEAHTPLAPLLSGVSPAKGWLTPVPAAADTAPIFWVLASPSASAAEVSSWWEMQMAPGETEDTE